MPSSHAIKEYHCLIRNDVFNLVPQLGGTLLDIGGGVGATAVELKRRGCADRVGVIDLISQSTEGTDLDFHYAGDLERGEVFERTVNKEGPFRTILCLDVLEHLVDPWSLIKKAHRALEPNGVIVASIPNVRYFQVSCPLFFKGKWELMDRGILDRTHLRWFVKKTASDLMTSSGLKIEKVVDKPGGGRKVKLIRAATLGMLNEFTNLQYLIRARNG